MSGGPAPHASTGVLTDSELERDGVSARLVSIVTRAARLTRAACAIVCRDSETLRLLSCTGGEIAPSLLALAEHSLQTAEPQHSTTEGEPEQLALPLRGDSQTREVLVLSRESGAPPLTPEQREHLEDLAMQAALVLDLARTKEERRSLEEELARIRQEQRPATEGVVEQPRRRSANLESLFMQAPAVLSIHRGPDHVYEFANIRAQALLGSPEMLGRKPREVSPVLDQFYAAADQVFHTGEPFQSEETPLTIQLDSGLREFFMTVVLQPLADENGKTDGVMFFGYDVTEQVVARKREQEAQRAREESAAVIDALFESSPLGLAFLDPQMRYVRLNSMLANLNRRSIQDHIGRTVREVLPYQAQFLEVPLKRALEGETILGQEFSGPLVDRPTDWGSWLVNFFPVRQHGQVIGVGAVVVDITDGRRVEQERDRLLAETQQALTMRDEFLSIAGHELRTPLTALKLNVEALSRSASQMYATPEGAERMQQRAQSAGQIVRRLTSLVDGLLDVSRLASGGLTIQRGPMSLSELCHEIAARFEVELERTGSPLTLQIESDIEGSWDEVRLDQVITNLLSNAFKYGRGKPVELSLHRDENIAVLLVRDHGPGIAPEHQERIFERFERAASERNFGGFGIGLWVVKQLVDAHGGVITVNSEPGEGSLFTVKLPLTTPATRS